MLPEQGEYAYLATAEALQNAGIDQDYINENEIGIFYGNDSSARSVIESIDIIRAKKDTMMVGSGAVFQTMNCTVTMNLATIFKLRGVNFTISAAPPLGIKPSLSRSNGLDALVGSDSRVEKADNASKVPMARWLISCAPPQMMRSCKPVFIK